MFKVFYSWQSDLPPATNRYLIQTALEKACSEVTNKNGIGVEAVLDRDTLGLSGSPDIRDAILEKIDDADAYVADITPVNAGADAARLMPNPNVLFEAGYARAKLGDDAIILVLNEHFGAPEQLPFDLRGLRLLTYCARPEDNERAAVRKGLQATLKAAIEAVGRVKRNDPIMEIAYPTTLLVAARAESMLSGLISGAGKSYDPKTITEQEVADVCSAINPNGVAPIVMHDPQKGLINGTWMAYLQNWRQESKSSTSEVLVFGAALDPTHVALLAAIDQCAYFKTLDLLRGTPLRNTDLTTFATDMWRYIMACRRLRDYATKVLARRAADL